MNDSPAPKKKLLIRNDLRFAQGGITLRQSLSRIGLTRALRRSSKIALWKRALPFIALLITVVMISWPYLVPEDKKFRIEVQEAPKLGEKNSRLLGLRFIGVDSQNQSYTISSVKAEQTDEKNSIITLTNPTSDLRMKDRRWFYLTSSQGILFNSEKRIELQGGVSVYNSEGFELHSEAININLNNKDMDSTRAIKGQGPTLSLEAEGMRLRENGDLLQLLGKSKVILRTGATESSDRRTPTNREQNAP